MNTLSKKAMYVVYSIQRLQYHVSYCILILKNICDYFATFSILFASNCILSFYSSSFRYSFMIMSNCTRLVFIINVHFFEGDR